MAISNLGTPTTASHTTLADLTFSWTLVAGSSRKLIVCVGGENGDAIDVTGITYDGVALTKAIDGNTGSTGFRQNDEMWYLDEAQLAGITNAAHDVVVSFSGTASSPQQFATANGLQGIEQGAPSQTDHDFATSTTSVSNQYTALASTEWAISHNSCGTNGSFTHSDSQNEISDQSGGGCAASMCQLEGGGGETSLSSTFSASANRFERITAVWDEAAAPPPAITNVTPDPLRMNAASMTITGTTFEASQGSALVRISDNATPGSGTVVNVTTAVTSWSDTSISLNLGNLSQALKDDLHTLGPGDGNRYVHVQNDTGDDSVAFAVHLMRPIAFELSASSNIAASGENTTAQLEAPATKTTGDFGGGRIQDDENPGDTVDLALDEYREDEWSLEATAVSVLGFVYQFRIVDSSGAVCNTYTDDPRWTVVKSLPNPTLNPPDNATDVAVNANCIMTFQAAIAKGTVGIATLGTNTSATTTGGDLTFQHTQVAGVNRKHVIRVVSDGSAAASISVTYGGVACAQRVLQSGSQASAFVTTAIFEILESSLPDDGTHDVVVTATGGTINDTTAHCASYAGVLQSAPNDTDSQHAGAGTFWVTTVDMSENDWALSCLGSNGTFTDITWTNALDSPTITTIGNFGSNNKLFVAEQQGHTAGSGSDTEHVATKSAGNANAAQCTISISPAPLEVHLYETGVGLVESLPVSDAKISVSGAVATIDWTNNLDPLTDYHVLIDSAAFVDDDTGTPWLGFQAATDWNFTTAAAGDNTPILSANF